jgi:hypothetical protein
MYILPTLTTETPLNTLPTPCRVVLVSLQLSACVLDGNLFFLNRQVAGHIRAGDFAAIGAMAEMAARFSEEFRVVDGDLDGAAETRGAHT